MLPRSSPREISQGVRTLAPAGSWYFFFLHVAMALKPFSRTSLSPFTGPIFFMGCLKSQATADTCLFATRLSKSVLLTKVSRRVCLDRKHLLSFCTKTVLKSPPPQLLGVQSPFAGPNWESPFAGPNCCKAFCRTMFKKALLQDLQSFSPHVFFTFLIWMAASTSFPFASSRLTLSPIFCSFSSFARHLSKGFPFAAPTSFLTACSSLTILVTLRAASFFGRALPTSDRTSASATWPSLSFFLPRLSSSSFSSSFLSFKAKGCLLPEPLLLLGKTSWRPCQPRSCPQLHPLVTLGFQLQPVCCFNLHIGLTLEAMPGLLLSPCHRLSQAELPLMSVSSVPPRIQVFFEWGPSASDHFHSSWPSMTCHTCSTSRSRLLQCSVSSSRSIPCGSCCTGCSTSTGASKTSSSTTCPVILGKALLQDFRGPNWRCVCWTKERSNICVFGCWKHVKIVVFVWKIQWVLSFQTNSSCWFISIKLAFQQWTSKPINLLNLFNRAHSGLSAKRAWLLKTIAFAESAVSKWKFGLFKLSKHLYCPVRS